jgi:hypothetical protein
MFCVSPLYAGEIVVDTGDAPGTFYLKVVVDSNGNATVANMKVVKLGDPTTPTVPDPEPPIGQPTAFEKAVTTITADTIQAGGTKNTGARIAAVYGLISKEIVAGNVPTNRAFEAVKMGTDLALNGQADKDKWTTWRGTVGEALSALQQDGSLTTAPQYAQAFKEIERGMNAATGFTGSPSSMEALADDKNKAFDLFAIIELVKMILELLKLFKM